MHGAITFEDVHFGYDASREVLSGVTFHARAGELIAVVGATGAGKTTLVSLVPRFYDPTAGRVLLDGIDVREFRLRALRQQVAMVLQQPLVFPTTLRENIAYGRPDASAAQIAAAAQLAQLDDFLARLPEGLDTVIGESGATLSGGEQLRITIARAILRDAPLLILDEPTAALDARAEFEVFRRFKGANKRRHSHRCRRCGAPTSSGLDEGASGARIVTELVARAAGFAQLRDAVRARGGGACTATS